jgi:hypothetical protein
MTANELRLGNWINVGGNSINTYQTYKPRQITANGIKAIEEENEERPDAVLSIWQPIELTEEWLLKFGFKTHDKHDYFIDISDSSVFHFWFSVYSGDGFYYIDAFDIKLKYVHQLQNLYFALTGQELIINT